MFTYLAVFLVEIAVVGIDGIVSGCVAKNKLEVGARRRERDLRVAFPTAILETYLTFLERPISVTSISHLQKKSRNIAVSNMHMLMHGIFYSGNNKCKTIIKMQ